ncbi:uncharacterized protein EAF01_005663 [Botrytis porri]|uniref:uncharacterized protein n=1 Tax=Botrytis porri TaxID=87229 RepID=UPI00190084A3|nr:uncharacterized protein EAF01_005663 [Botrytis porri]KAF7905142.1 hypothetical protein EAF01_005663 [Botrytis porri]
MSSFIRGSSMSIGLAYNYLGLSVAAVMNTMLQVQLLVACDQETLGSGDSKVLGVLLVGNTVAGSRESIDRINSLSKENKGLYEHHVFP